MKVLLSDKVKVTPVTLFAEVGLLERHPELARLCRRALAQEDRRLTEALCQQALPGVTAAGARSLVRGCADLDLCDREGTLRAAGERAAQDELVAVPEQGAYRLWLAEHPLFGLRVLHLERAAVDGKDTGFQSLEELPRIPPQNQVFTSMVDGSLRFVLRSKPEQCRVEEDEVIDLHWDLDFTTGHSHFTLTGTLRDDQEGELKLAAVPENVEVDHRALLRRWTQGAWDETAQRLRVPFENVPETALETFQMDWPLGEVEVPRRGRYQNAILREVPLAPASDDAALAWALWRFHRRRAAQRGYLARPALEAIFKDAIRGTPLEPHRLVLPPVDWLLKDREQARDRWGYWQVAAGEDLSL